VVPHQDLSVNLPIRLLARLGQGFDKTLAVHVVVEDVLAAACPSVASAEEDRSCS
jgi:hypothetical protein